MSESRGDEVIIGAEFEDLPLKTHLDIDSKTGGLWNGDLIVVGGRPGMGKMSLACTISNNAIQEDQRIVKFISLRANEKRLRERFLGLSVRASRETLFNTVRESNVNHIEAVKRGFEDIYGNNLLLDSMPGLTIDDLVDHLSSADNVFDLLVIDNLQLLSDDSKRFDNRWEEMVSICRKLKTVNLELDIPVIVLSHLSREVEYRGGNKRPQLSDLSDSGAIEQVADIVIFLYRPEYYGIKTTPEGQSTTGLVDFILGANNRGPCGIVPGYFYKEYGRFENITSEKE